ncbi:MAG: transglutaminase-like domain-containing protein [Clostridia bacterium]|nr:transglutaminase-like domain-containing protein [Clostridia bacterium]
MKSRKMKFAAVALSGVMIAASFAGCGSSTKTEYLSEQDVPKAAADETGLSADAEEGSASTGQDEEPAIETEKVVSGAPAVSSLIMPEASGEVTKGNGKVTIDMSNTSDGYIMVKYLAKTSKKLMLIVAAPDGVSYTYYITKIGDYETFPLSGGNGKYTVTVYENISGNQYSTVYSTSVSVKLTDEFAPFLTPNQYVNYNESSKIVSLAAQLTANQNNDVDKIKEIYYWVIGNISYDRELARSVKSGYLPDLDKLLTSKKGICFDYASLMTGMLRSQGIPAKLVVGYSGKAYHAWINAYTAEDGWINGFIYFDGQSWKLMDPTFASSGRESSSIMSYIGDGTNYQAKFLY